MDQKKPVWKIVVLGLIALIGAFCAVVSMQPSDYSVSRSVVIAAPAENVFPHLNDLQKWNDWSPWAKLDPNAKTTLTEATAGVNASMTWDGNDQVGAGQMTITETSPGALVRYRLDFSRPMEDTAMAEFTLAPADGGTHVTWKMYGQNDSFFKKAFWFALCQHMIGGAFDEGLQALKAKVETPA
jgi:uncharacterized protein YndB with AHSA1/START domain